MFRKIGIGFAFLCALTASAFAQVHVDGYYRNNGTYVAPHYRSSPDSSYNNNWSVSPNINPYSGQVGTRSPTLDDRAPSYGLGGSNNSIYGGSGNRRW